MNWPVDDLRIQLDFETIPTTQNQAVAWVKRGFPYGACTAKMQTAGRGRLDREWITAPGESLAATLIFWDHADHPNAAWLGMAMALAVARSFDAHVQWPNDVVYGDRKVAGILAETVLDPEGRRIPVVGVGVNLKQTEFPPEIAYRATSVLQATGQVWTPEEALHRIATEWRRLPEVRDWSDLEPIWQERDQTPGKLFRTPGGEVMKADGICAEGALVVQGAAGRQVITVADALFG
ncbi:MAG: biotin--[acetyl-CoA-carboxylase] ligase [Fimbriimonadaceae bacterium]|nr:biotin--[acetyl-CoA-carboxylase] ligase [Fimbriimonadaceae bacterium]